MSSESKRSKGCEGKEWWEMGEFWTPRQIPVRPSCSKSITEMDQDSNRRVRKSWVPCSGGFVPRGAFSIDDDDDCSFSAYVGIVWTDNMEWVPGMLLPEVGVVGVTRSGQRFTERCRYSALVGNYFYWYPYLKNVPSDDAVVICNHSGANFCIGRIEIDGVYYVGMVHEHILNVRYKENEISKFEVFDILCGDIFM
ncbi:Hypothetical predicted protein [Cloeon dipterum]|uniref:Uncharacterized protein n=1 Tax=Cloeon dipterum TaxID=197152 RepID=A0A8S1E501_9INSE|nr:Hypothetical predicted protein [Cloeon dipterum]